MKRKILFLTLILSCSNFISFAQACNCSQEFLYIKHKIEINYAGFKDKVNTHTRIRYDKATKAAMAQIKVITKPAYCTYAINQWLDFFQDGHIQIGRNRMSAPQEAAALEQRIQQTEVVSLTESQIQSLPKDDGISGFYRSKDSSYRIVVVPSPNTFRRYAGVVLQSKNNSWKRGQVILELMPPLVKDTLKGIAYDHYHIPLSIALSVTPNSIGDWQREGTDRKELNRISENEVESRRLSECTLYLKVGSFNQRNASRIDSIFTANKIALEKTPYLILDLRGNGGGADFTYAPILPYLYTDTIKSYGAEVLASEDNEKGWAALLAMGDLPADQKSHISTVVAQMKTHEGDFIRLSENDRTTFDSVKRYPKKVAILIDQGCGSTTEEFLLNVRQSSKVVFMGHHTAGVLDYANIRGAAFSCLPYTLYWATSRSKRIDQGLGIDKIGIKPDKVLTMQENWIKQAQQFLESNN